MAPTNYKAKNDNKSSSGADAGTQGPSPILALVQEAATLDSNSNMKQAAAITLKIVQRVQSVKDHKANFQKLADDVAGLIAGIWKSYQELPADEKQNWPPKSDIEELVPILEPILAFVEDQVKRSRTGRVLNNFTDRDSGKIQEYRERVQGAIRKFKANPHINHALNQVKIEEEKERTPNTELLQLTEEKKARLIEEPYRLQAKEKIHVTDEEARKPHQLSHISNERAKERFQDPESDRLAKEERRELERLREENRMMKEAKRNAEEKERERKREEKEKDRIAAEERENERRRQSKERVEEQLRRERIRKREEKEEMDRITAERENERRHQSEEMARVEAEEQERIRISEDQRTLEWARRKLLEEQVREEAMERRRETEATRIPEGKKKKEKAVSGKMKSRVEEEDDEQTAVSEQDESGEESSSESAQEPARKPANKNTKAHHAPKVPRCPSPEPPTFPPSAPPHFWQHPSDVFQHPWYPSCIAPTNGSLPATNHVSGFNNARVTGGVNIGNITNSDSTRGGDTVRQERAAVPRQKQASQTRHPKSSKVKF